LDKIDPRWDISGSPEFIQNPGYPGLENLFQRYPVENFDPCHPTPFGPMQEKQKKGTYRFLCDGVLACQASALPLSYAPKFKSGKRVSIPNSSRSQP